MNVRLSLALVLAATTPALAQQAPRPAPVTAQAADDSFDKDLDALFTASGLTADQAASRAAKASPSVRRKAAEVEASLAQVQAAELARVPHLEAKAGYTRLSPLDPLSFGPGGPAFEFPVNVYATNATIGIPLSEYVLRFPKLIDAAKLGVEAAKTGERASEVNASQEARLSYYELVRARLQVFVAERQLAQVQTVLKQVRALAEAQRVSKADLMRVESNEAQAEQVLNQLRNVAALREEQLQLLMGADQPITLGEDPRTDVNAPGAGELDDLAKKATSQRLEFRAIDLGIQAREKQRESEKASTYPHLSAFASADYANPNQRIFPQTAEWNFTWSAGVQLTWTLNDALQARATDRRITAETNELRADRENLARGTRIELLAAQQAVQLAQMSLQTSQKGLAAAEEGYRVRRELLNAERATAVELVDAETDLTRARIAALNARVDLHVAMAQLAHALGEDVAKK
ncbi:MAG TPA: TolC family protein [Kofleriaceae bacterium]|nr:TolC family protein [Kofleriaceae bacterium]